MLVLTRKRWERVQIGDRIWVTVVQLDKNRVRLGIEAPRGVSIVRGELLEREAEPSHAGAPGDDGVAGR